MPHYKDDDDRVFWLDDEPERPDLVPITDQEAATLLRPSLTDRKLALWAEAKARRDGLTDAPGAEATTPFGLVQVDAKSKQNINGLVTMALIAQGAGAPFSSDFTLADNSVVTLDAPKMIGLGVAIGRYVEAVYSHARVLRDALVNAVDHKELDAIDVTAGWP